jgi:hypothetical protein
MASYRLYFHNAEGGFMRRRDVDVADDEAALQAAREIDHAHCIEVWRGKRQVGIVQPAESD